MDNLTREQRRKNMQAIKSFNTKPELLVRKILSGKRIYYRIKNVLPGKPDLVISKLKIAIFVNGCFWHHHKGCKRATLPKSNQEYWNSKIFNNINRDKKVKNDLQKLGWNVVIIWECETKDKNKLEKLIDRRLKKYLCK